MARRFNHDLMLDTADQELARDRWPALGPRLVNPMLNERFAEFDRQAKRFKQITNTMGTLGVVFLMLALVLEVIDVWNAGQGASEPIWVALVGWPAEIIGLLGLVLAFLGSRWGPFRRRWLFARFACECLRQWHFRSLLLSCSTSDKAGPHRADDGGAGRDTLLAPLVRVLENEGRERMDGLRERRVVPYDLPWPPKLSRDAAHADEVLEAYRELRVEHQLNYMVHKTGVDARTCVFLSPADLLRIVDFFAAFTLVAGLLLSFVQIFVDEASFLGGRAPYASLLMVMLGVCVRAWRDGHALGEENEHYHEVRHRMEMFQVRWTSTQSNREHYALALELEDMALEELRSFLRTHEKAQFIL